VATGDPPTHEVTVVSGPAGGGEVSRRVTVLEGEVAIAKYARQFRGPLARSVNRAAGEISVPTGDQLVAAVVAVGCDVPSGVEITGAGPDARFVVGKPAAHHPECFAPVTTVAVAVVPATS
jgi:hypothetical protein